MFELKEHGTSIIKEMNAGLATFLAMAYIVPVNAIIMSKTGMPMDALITATALITIIATLINGIWANTPIAMSVGMGLNAYFTYGLVLGMKIPWQTALGIVFISGILFVILSFTKFREWVLYSVPADVRRAISAGIGLFIAFIGLKEMKLIVANQATYVGLGDLSDPNVVVGLFGLLIVAVLYAWKIRGAFVLSVLITALLAWFLGLAQMPQDIFSTPASISPILLELDIKSALTLSLLPVIVTFALTDMLDTVGTLAGVGNRAGIFEEEPKISRTLEADAVATVAGSILGTSTTTSFIESAAGVEEGGKTGLTAVFTALFFISTLFMLPIFKAIHPNAIHPILVMVGVLMFSELGKIEFKDPSVSVSSFLTVIMIPLTFSITIGLAFGFVSYFLLKVAKAEFKDINIGIIFLAIIGLIVFYFQGVS
jgi:AGZA family xanthine/uracil permease-like MFS transporter